MLLLLVLLLLLLMQLVLGLWLVLLQEGCQHRPLDHFL
jgi:hypothetical protein